MHFRRFLSIMVAISAAFSAVFPFGDAYTPDTFPIIGVTEKADDTVRVMSFNIRCKDVGGVPAAFRRWIVLEQILRVAPDSLGVQEATPDWMWWLRRLPQYGVVGACRDGKGKDEYNPVLYNREKYQLIDSETFWLSETPQAVSDGWDAACKRICTWALLENRETGERYVHVNTHFDHMGRVAVRKEAELVSTVIAEKFADLPVVFTADMNARPGSVPYEIMTQTLTDTRLAAPDSQSIPTYHDTRPMEDPEDTIDYVLCSADVTPLVYRTVTEGVNGRFVSDHFPIYADVQMQTEVR